MPHLGGAFEFRPALLLLRIEGELTFADPAELLLSRGGRGERGADRRRVELGFLSRSPRRSSAAPRPPREILSWPLPFREGCADRPAAQTNESPGGMNRR